MLISLKIILISLKHKLNNFKIILIIYTSNLLVEQEMVTIIDEMTSLLIEHSRILYQVISDMGVYYTSWQEAKKSNQKNLAKKKAKLLLLEEDADSIVAIVSVTLLNTLLAPVLYCTSLSLPKSFTLNSLTS